MSGIDQFKPLIRQIAFEENCPAILIEAQVIAESAGNPDAKSCCGALGLLQLMPGTFEEVKVGPISSIFDPATNLRAGCRYLRRQFDALTQLVPDVIERWKFSLASYNGGRGYIIKAILLSKIINPQERTWSKVAPLLSDPRCTVGKKRPDHKQITGYVKKIFKYIDDYFNKETIFVPRKETD